MRPWPLGIDPADYHRLVAHDEVDLAIHVSFWGAVNTFARRVGITNKEQAASAMRAACAMPAVPSPEGR